MIETPPLPPATARAAASDAQSDADDVAAQRGRGPHDPLQGRRGSRAGAVEGGDRERAVGERESFDEDVVDDGARGQCRRDKRRQEF